jgi:hypothetical protein
VHEKLRDQGVVFIGLTPEPKESNSDSLAFLNDNKITWANGFGAQKTLAAYKTACYPSAWVVGRDGKVVWNRDAGQSIEDAIAAALKDKA